MVSGLRREPRAADIVNRTRQLQIAFAHTIGYVVDVEFLGVKCDVDVAQTVSEREIRSEQTASEGCYVSVEIPVAYQPLPLPVDGKVGAE